MPSHSPTDLEEFMASPEMEAAFNAWLAKRNPAMVDLSDGALEPFPAIAISRYAERVRKDIEAGKFAPDVTDESIALAFDLLF